MKEGWEYKTLGECCEKINGLWKGKKEPFVNVGVIRNANFTKEMTLDFSNIEYLYVEEKQFKTRKLRKGDLIVEKSGGSEKQPVGRAVLFLKEEGDYSFSNFTSVLRILNKDELLYNFLYKYLLYIYRRGDTKSMQKATTGIHNIEFEKYLNIQVPIIPMDEQRRIVSYFDSSFKLIDEIKDKALKSLTEAKALFQSALAEAMEPKEGWEEKTLGEICSKIGSGATPKGGKKIYIKNGVSIIRSLNVHRNFFKYEDLAHIDNNSAKKLDNVIVKNNDVLFNITGASIARCCVVPKDVLPARVNQHVSIIRIKEGIIPHFLCYLLNSKNYQLILLGIGESGSTRQAITKSDLEHFVIAYPPLSTQKQIVSHLDKLSSKVRAMEEKYQKMVEECDALKQAMLRDVFE